MTVLTERSIEDKRLGRSGASTQKKFSKQTPPTIKKMSSLRYNAKSVHKQFDLVKTEGGSGTVVYTRMVYTFLTSSDGGGIAD